MEKELKWRRLNGEPLGDELLASVEKVIKREFALGNRLKVCIGSDSQVKGGTVEYATVIVFLREKKGGFMFVSSESKTHNISLKERMITEVARSVQVAYSLCDLLDKYSIELEVHADINTDPEFPSNVALKEAMGYIKGMGFIFKAKPNAFASSCCADKMV
ncbi:MAG: ribonuclease H-like YkuK family protein [Saprospiraceae bacterium]|nr:ribonuclease H-like YkuK family protein [Saprospiraceae bacterium]